MPFNPSKRASAGAASLAESELIPQHTGVFLRQKIGNKKQCCSLGLGGREQRYGTADQNLHRLPPCFLKRALKKVKRLFRIFRRLVSKVQHRQALGFRRNYKDRVVEVLVIPLQYNAIRRFAGRGQRQSHDAALTRRDVHGRGFADKTVSVRPGPAYMELFTAGISGIADTHPSIRAGLGAGLVRFVDPLQRSVAGTPGRERHDRQFHASRPFVTLEGLETAAFLEVADEHNLPRALTSVAMGIGQAFGGGNKRASQMRAEPTR